jgi:signal transduction histidine kinase
LFGVIEVSPSPALLAIIAVVMIGFAVIWGNPHRAVNRVFLTTALHVAAWLFCVHQAVDQGESLIWIQFASVIGAFLPAHLWIVKEATIISPGSFWKRMQQRCWVWMVAGLILAALCFSDAFGSTSASQQGPDFGAAYYVYMLGVLGLYGMLCRETVLQIRTLQGLGRLELQIMLLGGSATAGTVILLMALRGLLKAIWPIELQPVIVMIFYAITVITISTHRVFDARQILRVGLQKVLLVSLTTIVAFVIDWLAKTIMPSPLDLLVTVAVILWFAAILNGGLQRAFHFYPEAIDARQATFAAARRERHLDSLEGAFLSILKGWGQSEHALLISGGNEGLRGCGITLANDSPTVLAMRRLRWVTPERLMREKPTPEREEIARFVGANNLGVLVMAEGSTLTTLVGVGIAASRRPFTFPQVTQLIELASIIESSIERAHFSLKVQHAEQLATVGLLGASLAHEIRNPLVSIKTFVQLLPSHHQDPAFREKFFRLISDEVGRIDSLTEQLLDLASPRAYSAQLIELHPILAASLELATAKAMHKNIRFLTEFRASPDRAFTDASAAKQVMLNLCFNAIQAVESHQNGGTERWVKIATRNTSAGIEMLVADSGPGIAPEVRPKLFQPFQTTKSTGFGLGLAICSDILANLHASITVDPPTPGRGATFRVTFPCQPLSS